MKKFIEYIMWVFLISSVYIGCLLMTQETQPKLEFKTVVRIESCAKSGRCRVYFDDDSTDLLYYPYIGMKVIKEEK